MHTHTLNEEIKQHNTVTISKDLLTDFTFALKYWPFSLIFLKVKVYMLTKEATENQQFLLPRLVK